MEIADALRQYGAESTSDTRELWRRMLFNVLISNTDDHPRNHGFIYVGPSGWRLSPAYDLNPVPADIRPRIISMTIDEADGICSLGLIMKHAEYFDISAKHARVAAKEVANVVKNWRGKAQELGIPKGEIERMATAFEHDDLRNAAKL